MPVIGVARQGWKSSSTRRACARASRPSCPGRTRPWWRASSACCATSTATTTRPRPSWRCAIARAAAAAAVLSGDPTEHVRRSGRTPERGCSAAWTRGWWSRSPSAATSLRAQPLNRDPARALPREQHLSHRPLPRQGGGAEPPLFPLCQLLPRAGAEPQLRRERADHHGRDARRRRPRASSTRRPARSAT